MVRCLKSGLGFLPAAIRQHVSSGPNQQYYTSLSSRCSVRDGVTHLSTATLSSESITVTSMDPDSISLAEGGVIPGDIKRNLSNVTAVTSLSHDLATQDQADRMCNGSVNAFGSLDQRELEMRTISKSPSSGKYVHNDENVGCSGLVMPSECVLSARNHTGSPLSPSNDKQDPKVICNSSVKSSTVPVNYNGGKLVTGHKDEDLFTVDSEFDVLSGKNCEEHDSEDDTGNEDTTLSSASTGDDSDSSTTDIDAIVAEYKEQIKVRLGWKGIWIILNAGSLK
jgi:hypothetical protein